MSKQYSRRAYLGTVAAGTVGGLAGCTDSSDNSVGTEVAGFETVTPGVYDVSLDEGEYTVRQHTAEANLEFVATFGIDTGEMLVALMSSSEFLDYEDGDDFVGTWDVFDPTEQQPLRLIQQFQRGEEFMVVADNTGSYQGHNPDGPVEGRLEEQAMMA